MGAMQVTSSGGPPGTTRASCTAPTAVTHGEAAQGRGQLGVQLRGAAAGQPAGRKRAAAGARAHRAKQGQRYPGRTRWVRWADGLAACVCGVYR